MYELAMTYTRRTRIEDIHVLAQAKRKLYKSSAVAEMGQGDRNCWGGTVVVPYPFTWRELAGSP